MKDLSKTHIPTYVRVQIQRTYIPIQGCTCNTYERGRKFFRLPVYNKRGFVGEHSLCRFLILQPNKSKSRDQTYYFDSQKSYYKVN